MVDILVLTAVVAAVAVIRIMKYLTSVDTTPPATSKGMTVSAINIYPIKGCKGTSLSSAQTDRLGFVNDRRWMLVDNATDPLTFASQREYPSMANIHPRIVGQQMVVCAPGMPDLVIDLDVGQAIRHDSGNITVQIWKQSVVCATVSEDADAWFSAYLGVPISFVSTLGAAEHVRPLPKKWFPIETEHDASVGFADGYPFLLIGEGSLAEINSRVEPHITMASFRPNVVVSNSAPWEEDHWRQITVGSIEFEVPEPCARCQVPTVDPDTGSRRRGYEPIKTMKTYRSDADGEVYCGQNIVHLYNGVVNVGDAVTVRGYKQPVVAPLTPLERLRKILIF